MGSRVRKRSSSTTEKGLTEERIVSVALQKIDEIGLTKFSLRDVARALHVYPTAVLWYVKSREDLLGRVVAYATRHVAPPAARADWQAWLRELFHRYRKVIQQHPNIAPLLSAQLRSNAGIRADMIDRILSVLLTAGFSDDQLVDAYNVVIGALVGFVGQELAAMPAENPKKWAEIHRKRISNLDVMAHPTLARYLPKLANKAFIVRWSNGVEVPLDSAFEMLIDVIVVGLDQKRRTRSK